MDKMVEDYTITRGKEIQELVQNVERIKELLEEYFKFEIPYYVALDIAENETYNHICYMIGLATINERLSQGNAATLKQGIKELFNVKNKYDNVESKILINKF